MAALLAVLVLTTIAFVIGLNSDDPDPTTADPDATPSSSTSDEPVAASAEDMEAFIDDYLSLVTQDPEAAFEMLTPAYQEASNGIEGYRGFWDTVASTKLDVGRRGPGDARRRLPLHLRRAR